MVYTMKIYVDGGCRNNGYSNAFGAAAAIREGRWNRYWYSTKRLTHGNATSQRAEITAISLGLEMALEKARDVDCKINLTLYSDSRYAVNCMNEWINKWFQNGWINARGEPVANQDLIKRASRLDGDVKEIGSVLDAMEAEDSDQSDSDEDMSD